MRIFRKEGLWYFLFRVVRNIFSFLARADFVLEMLLLQEKEYEKEADDPFVEKKKAGTVIKKKKAADSLEKKAPG